MVVFLAYEASKLGLDELDLLCPTPGIGSLLGSENTKMTEDEFMTKSNIILIAWCAWMILAWLFTGSQKAIFSYMGENLTYEVRMELIRALLHK